MTTYTERITQLEAEHGNDVFSATYHGLPINLPYGPGLEIMIEGNPVLLRFRSILDVESGKLGPPIMQIFTPAKLDVLRPHRVENGREYLPRAESSREGYSYIDLRTHRISLQPRFNSIYLGSSIQVVLNPAAPDDKGIIRTTLEVRSNSDLRVQQLPKDRFNDRLKELGFSLRRDEPTQPPIAS